jgi:TolA-binding protein
MILTRLVGGAIAIALVSALAPVAQAQFTPADPLQNNNPTDRDPRAIAPGLNLTPAELMRQIQSNSGQTPEEFRNQQDRRLSPEVEAFQRLQNQRIQEQQQRQQPQAQP